MANNQITISLVADNSKLVSGLKTGQQQLQAFNQGIQSLITLSTQGKSATLSLRGAQGQWTTSAKEAARIADLLIAEKREMLLIDEQITAALSKQQVAALRNAGMMQNMHLQAGGASFALLSLAQGLQDSAQFGMGAAQGLRAVNNNLQQFATSLAFAAGASGGFGKLIKDLKKAFWGPTGFIIMFSAASAAMEFFALRTQRAKKEAEDAGRVWEDAAGKVFRFQDALSGMAFTIPEGAVTPLRAALEGEIEEIDRIISLSEEIPSIVEMAFAVQPQGGSVSFPDVGRIVELTDEQLRKNEEIEGAKARVAEMDMDAIEGQRQLLRLLRQQEGFLQKRNELIDLAKSLGLDFESTSKRTLTTIQKLRNEWEDLVKAFSGSGEAERQEGSLRARIELLKNMRDATVDYSRSIEEMRIAMSQEGVELLRETKYLQDANEKLQERLRLKRELLGLEKISAETLRTLNDASMTDLQSEYDRYIEEQNRIIDANQRFRESLADLGTDLIVSVAQIGGGMNGLTRTFGSFFERYGTELVKMGISTILLGTALKGVREALKNLNPVIAITAGVALVAAGSRLKRQGKSSAAALSRGTTSGGSRGVSSAPTFFTGFGNVSDIPGSSITPPITSANRRTQSVEFTVVGRNLVGVLDNNAQASQRVTGRNMVVGAAGSSTGGGITPILEF